MQGLRSVRIDGSTASRSRDEQCRLFQENDDVVVAVLSMTAAGIGITLTAASVVVFAELHWNPGVSFRMHHSFYIRIDLVYSGLLLCLTVNICVS